VECLDRLRRVFANRVVVGRGIIGSKECQIRLEKLAVADQTVNCQNLALMANCVDCCCSVEENLWPTGSPIAKPATSANGSNCLYKLTPQYPITPLQTIRQHPIR